MPTQRKMRTCHTSKNALSCQLIRPFYYGNRLPRRLRMAIHAFAVTFAGERNDVYDADPYEAEPAPPLPLPPEPCTEELINVCVFAVIAGVPEILRVTYALTPLRGPFVRTLMVNGTNAFVGNGSVKLLKVTLDEFELGLVTVP